MLSTEKVNTAQRGRCLLPVHFYDTANVMLMLASLFFSILRTCSHQSFTSFDQTQMKIGRMSGNMVQMSITAKALHLVLLLEVKNEAIHLDFI